MKDIADAKSDFEKRQKLIEEKAREFFAMREGRKRVKIPSLTVRITASDEAENMYNISVQNSGDSTFRNIRVLYEATLLYLGNFGLDTTYMRNGQQFYSGESLIIDELLPNAVVGFSRRGCRGHDEYDGPAKTFARILDMKEAAKPIPPALIPWCDVIVELPKARGIESL
jgi:hypothetical protein